jgi:hypothetical protein
VDKKFKLIREPRLVHQQQGDQAMAKTLYQEFVNHLLYKSQHQI